VRRLRADGHDVVQLVRREPRAPGEARWDPAAGTVQPGALDGVQAGINLAGAGIGDRRWTPEYKEVLRRSRLDTTSTLARALAELSPRPQVLLNASGIDAYGDRGEEVLTEASAVGTGFLPGLVAAWEAATAPAREAGIRVVTLRNAPVMGPHGGAFGRMLLLFRLGLGGPFGLGRAWFPWITLPDHLDAVRFLLTADVHGPVNLTSPVPSRNLEVTRALARALHRPAVLPVPPLALRVVLGEFAGDLLASKRAVPQALVDAGFRFAHPDIDTAATWLAGAR
jgi:uncharacterized protein